MTFSSLSSFGEFFSITHPSTVASKAAEEKKRESGIFKDEIGKKGEKNAPPSPFAVLPQHQLTTDGIHFILIVTSKLTPSKEKGCGNKAESSSYRRHGGSGAVTIKVIGIDNVSGKLIHHALIGRDVFVFFDNDNHRRQADEEGKEEDSRRDCSVPSTAAPDVEDESGLVRDVDANADEDKNNDGQDLDSGPLSFVNACLTEVKMILLRRYCLLPAEGEGSGEDAKRKMKKDLHHLARLLIDSTLSVRFERFGGMIRTMDSLHFLLIRETVAAVTKPFIILSAQGEEKGRVEYGGGETHTSSFEGEEEEGASSKASHHFNALSTSPLLPLPLPPFVTATRSAQTLQWVSCPFVMPAAAIDVEQQTVARARNEHGNEVSNVLLKTMQNQLKALVEAHTTTTTTRARRDGDAVVGLLFSDSSSAPSSSSSCITRFDWHRQPSSSCCVGENDNNDDYAISSATTSSNDANELCWNEPLLKLIDAGEGSLGRISDQLYDNENKEEVCDSTSSTATTSTTRAIELNSAATSDSASASCPAEVAALLLISQLSVRLAFGSVQVMVRERRRGKESENGPEEKKKEAMDKESKFDILILVRRISTLAMSRRSHLDVVNPTAVNLQRTLAAFQNGNSHHHQHNDFSSSSSPHQHLLVDGVGIKAPTPFIEHETDWQVIQMEAIKASSTLCENEGNTDEKNDGGRGGGIENTRHQDSTITTFRILSEDFCRSGGLPIHWGCEIELYLQQKKQGAALAAQHRRLMATAATMMAAAANNNSNNHHGQGKAKESNQQAASAAKSQRENSPNTNNSNVFGSIPNVMEVETGGNHDDDEEANASAKKKGKSSIALPHIAHFSFDFSRTYGTDASYRKINRLPPSVSLADVATSLLPTTSISTATTKGPRYVASPSKIANQQVFIEDQLQQLQKQRQMTMEDVMAAAAMTSTITTAATTTSDTVENNKSSEALCYLNLLNRRYSHSNLSTPAAAALRRHEWSPLSLPDTRDRFYDHHRDSNEAKDAESGVLPAASSSSSSFLMNLLIQHFPTLVPTVPAGDSEDDEGNHNTRQHQHQHQHSLSHLFVTEKNRGRVDLPGPRLPLPWWNGSGKRNKQHQKKKRLRRFCHTSVGLADVNEMTSRNLLFGQHNNISADSSSLVFSTPTPSVFEEEALGLLSALSLFVFESMMATHAADDRLPFSIEDCVQLVCGRKKSWMSDESCDDNNGHDDADGDDDFVCHVILQTIRSAAGPSSLCSTSSSSTLSPPPSLPSAFSLDGRRAVLHRAFPCFSAAGLFSWASCGADVGGYFNETYMRAFGGKEGGNNTPTTAVSTSVRASSSSKKKKIKSDAFTTACALANEKASLFSSSGIVARAKSAAMKEDVLLTGAHSRAAVIKAFVFSEVHEEALYHSPRQRGGGGAEGYSSRRRDRSRLNNNANNGGDTTSAPNSPSSPVEFLLSPPPPNKNDREGGSEDEEAFLNSSGNNNNNDVNNNTNRSVTQQLFPNCDDQDNDGNEPHAKKTNGSLPHRHLRSSSSSSSSSFSSSSSSESEFSRSNNNNVQPQCSPEARVEEWLLRWALLPRHHHSNVGVVSGSRNSRKSKSRISSTGASDFIALPPPLNVASFTIALEEISLLRFICITLPSCALRGEGNTSSAPPPPQSQPAYHHPITAPLTITVITGTYINEASYRVVLDRAPLPLKMGGIPLGGGGGGGRSSYPSSSSSSDLQCVFPLSEDWTVVPPNPNAIGSSYFNNRQPVVAGFVTIELRGSGKYPLILGSMNNNSNHSSGGGGSPLISLFGKPLRFAPPWVRRCLSLSTVDGRAEQQAIVKAATAAISSAAASVSNSDQQQQQSRTQPTTAATATTTTTMMIDVGPNADALSRAAASPSAANVLKSAQTILCGLGVTFNEIDGEVSPPITSPMTPPMMSAMMTGGESNNTMSHQQQQHHHTTVPSSSTTATSPYEQLFVDLALETEFMEDIRTTIINKMPAGMMTTLNNKNGGGRQSDFSYDDNSYRGGGGGSTQDNRLFGDGHYYCDPNATPKRAFDIHQSQRQINQQQQQQQIPTASNSNFVRSYNNPSAAALLAHRGHSMLSTLNNGANNNDNGNPFLSSSSSSQQQQQQSSCVNLLTLTRNQRQTSGLHHHQLTTGPSGLTTPKPSRGGGGGGKDVDSNNVISIRLANVDSSSGMFALEKLLAAEYTRLTSDLTRAARDRCLHKLGVINWRMHPVTGILFHWLGIGSPSIPLPSTVNFIQSLLSQQQQGTNNNASSPISKLIFSCRLSPSSHTSTTAAASANNNSSSAAPAASNGGGGANASLSSDHHHNRQQQLFQYFVGVCKRLSGGNGIHFAEDVFLLNPTTLMASIAASAKMNPSIQQQEREMRRNDEINRAMAQSSSGSSNKKGDKEKREKEREKREKEADKKCAGCKGSIWFFTTTQQCDNCRAIFCTKCISKQKSRVLMAKGLVDPLAEVCFDCSSALSQWDMSYSECVRRRNSDSLYSLIAFQKRREAEDEQRRKQKMMVPTTTATASAANNGGVRPSNVMKPRAVSSPPLNSSSLRLPPNIRRTAQNLLIPSSSVAKVAISSSSSASLLRCVTLPPFVALPHPQQHQYPAARLMTTASPASASASAALSLTSVASSLLFKCVPIEEVPIAYFVGNNNDDDNVDKNAIPFSAVIGNYWSPTHAASQKASPSTTATRVAAQQQQEEANNLAKTLSSRKLKKMLMNRSFDQITLLPTQASSKGIAGTSSSPAAASVTPPTASLPSPSSCAATIAPPPPPTPPPSSSTATRQQTISVEIVFPNPTTRGCSVELILSAVADGRVLDKSIVDALMLLPKSSPAKKVREKETEEGGEAEDPIKTTEEVPSSLSSLPLLVERLITIEVFGGTNRNDLMPLGHRQSIKLWDVAASSPSASATAFSMEDAGAERAKKIGLHQLLFRRVHFPVGGTINSSSEQKEEKSFDAPESLLTKWMTMPILILQFSASAETFAALRLHCITIGGSEGCGSPSLLSAAAAATSTKNRRKERSGGGGEKTLLMKIAKRMMMKWKKNNNEKSNQKKQEVTTPTSAATSSPTALISAPSSTIASVPFVFKPINMDTEIAPFGGVAAVLGHNNLLLQQQQKQSGGGIQMLSVSTISYDGANRTKDANTSFSAATATDEQLKSTAIAVEAAVVAKDIASAATMETNNNNNNNASTSASSSSSLRINRACDGLWLVPVRETRIEQTIVVTSHHALAMMTTMMTENNNNNNESGGGINSSPHHPQQQQQQIINPYQHMASDPAILKGQPIVTVSRVVAVPCSIPMTISLQMLQSFAKVSSSSSSAQNDTSAAAAASISNTDISNGGGLLSSSSAPQQQQRVATTSSTATAPPTTTTHPPPPAANRRKQGGGGAVLPFSRSTTALPYATPLSLLSSSSRQVLAYPPLSTFIIPTFKACHIHVASTDQHIYHFDVSGRGSGAEREISETNDNTTSSSSSRQKNSNDKNGVANVGGGDNNNNSNDADDANNGGVTVCGFLLDFHTPALAAAARFRSESTSMTIKDLLSSSSSSSSSSAPTVTTSSVSSSSSSTTTTASIAVTTTRLVTESLLESIPIAKVIRVMGVNNKGLIDNLGVFHLPFAPSTTTTNSQNHSVAAPLAFAFPSSAHNIVSIQIEVLEASPVRYGNINNMNNNAAVGQSSSSNTNSNSNTMMMNNGRPPSDPSSSSSSASASTIITLPPPPPPFVGLIQFWGSDNVDVRRACASGDYFSAFSSVKKALHN